MRTSVVIAVALDATSALAWTHMNRNDFPSALDGWTAFFSTQLTLDELATTVPARVVAVHRDRLVVLIAGGELSFPPFRDGSDETDVATAGDWLLLDAATRQPLRLLQRRSLFQRRAAGRSRKRQLIAANVDTLFVVSSCNQDFNPARLERYLCLAQDAGVQPVVVLTKADLCDRPADYVRAAERLSPGLVAETVDARDAVTVHRLRAWCNAGSTVALLGSSGVGKSTLANTLAGTRLATQPARIDDDRGRHTTTARMLLRLPGGGWLLDTPGMRELALTDGDDAVAAVFDDVLALAARCRFGDCRHVGEPGCAVDAAIAAGALDPARLQRWRKLAAETAVNAESLAERRARERAFGKLARHVMAHKRRQRGD